MCPLFCGSLLALALLLLALTALPLFPSDTLISDTAAHFMPLYPVVAFLLLLLALASLSPGAVVVVSGLAFLMSFFQLSPLGTLPPIDMDKRTLSILQINIKRTTTDTQALRRLIDEHQPDLIAIQEANTAAGKLLDTLRDAYPHQHRALQDQHSFGMAVASNQPLGDVEVLTFSHAHIPVFRFNQKLAGRDIEVVTVHPANPLRDFPSRSADMEGLAEYLQAIGEKPRIVTGDMNVTPFAHGYRAFIKKLALHNARDMHGAWRHYAQGTWPAWLPAPLRLSIDHTLHTPELRTAQHRVLEDIGSDHLPSLTMLSWR